MKLQHQDLASGRWAQLSLVEQMAHIGSEVERTMRWQEKKQPKLSQQALFRALELVCLSIENTKDSARLKELCRLHETLVDYFVGDNNYNSSSQLWRKYFHAFTYAAALQAGR